MEVTKPSPSESDDHHQFNFNSTSASPYVTAPSSPQRFGKYIFTTAPATPTRAAADFNPNSGDTFAATIPFNWEEKPGTPKSVSSPYDTDQEEDDDFAFDFSGQLDRPYLSAADDLFSGGKIKPLKLPPSLNNLEMKINVQSPKSPRERIKEALSPRKKKNIDDQFDPFAAALEETRRPEKIPAANWYKKWKLKNLLLFRSASEGHKEKYAVLKKSNNNNNSFKDSKNWSFRSADSEGGPAVGSRKMSAHEWHYTVNRTAAEEMKKKTYLPYKQGLFGCLGFRVDEISNRGIVSAMTRE